MRNRRAKPGTLCADLAKGLTWKRLAFGGARVVSLQNGAGGNSLCKSSNSSRRVILPKANYRLGEARDQTLSGHALCVQCEVSLSAAAIPRQMVPACHGLMATWFTKARTTSGLAPRVSFCSRRYFFRVRVPVLSLVPSPNSSDGAGMQRHIALRNRACRQG